MKVVYLIVGFFITATLAHAEDMAEMISQYRREHGLSAVKTNAQLTAIAERQAKAMAASGIMDHSVAGSFSSRVSSAHLGIAAENIAAGTKTWAETFRMWQTSPGHNANALAYACQLAQELVQSVNCLDPGMLIKVRDDIRPMVLSIPILAACA